MTEGCEREGGAGETDGDDRSCGRVGKVWGRVVAGGLRWGRRVRRSFGEDDGWWGMEEEVEGACCAPVDAAPPLLAGEA